MAQFNRLVLATTLVLATAITLLGSSRLARKWVGEAPAEPWATRGSAGASPFRPYVPWTAQDSIRLRSACDERAAELRSQSRGQLAVLVRAPWILAGEATCAELQTTYEVTIEPAWRAMAREYFHTAPDRPITVLLCSTERAYRDWAEQLFFDRGVSRFGYYKPGRRTIVVNLAEGTGALLHEMTHALMACDFPDAPLWFEEGLASLHEAAGLEVSAQGMRLKGCVNWRLQILRRSIRNGRLPCLQTLFQVRELRGPDEAIRYAEARYFCLFLQDENLLTAYYQRLRHSGDRDPRGEQALKEILPDASWTALDARFLRWLSSLEDSALRLTMSECKVSGLGCTLTAIAIEPLRPDDS